MWVLLASGRHGRQDGWCLISSHSAHTGHSQDSCCGEGKRDGARERGVREGKNEEREKGGRGGETEK